MDDRGEESDNEYIVLPGITVITKQLSHPQLLRLDSVAQSNMV